MNRKTSAVALATLTLAPQVALPVAAFASTSPTSATGKLYTGRTASMRWGPVTVRIRVRNHKIVNVGATVPTERRRSEEINSRAVPVLKSEALRAQSWRVNAVSGATMTSDAYAASLRTAMAKAGL
jgi:uncharacterized protein with FMN-binding domain